MDKKDILALVQEAFNGLEASGLLAKHIDVDEQTVLMGAGMVLDSIGFVTMFMDLEERLQEKSGQEIYLLIDEVNDVGSMALTVGGLMDYIDGKLKA